MVSFVGHRKEVQTQRLDVDRATAPENKNGLRLGASFTKLNGIFDISFGKFSLMKYVHTILQSNIIIFTFVIQYESQ
jgi:hypothetical protein